MNGGASADLQIVLLNEGRDRGGFTCGIESQDRDLTTQATRTFVRRRMPCSCSARDTSQRVSLVTTPSRNGNLVRRRPGSSRRRDPRYPLVSAILISRLAVVKDRQGQRLGAILLADDLPSTFESASTIGSSMVIVDPLG